MQRNIENAPWRASLNTGIIAGIFLLLLATIILAQLIFNPYSQGVSGLFSFDPQIVKILTFTAYQAALSTALSLALGILLAWALSHRRQFPFRNLLISLISSALVLPTLVVVLGLVSVYGRNGWLAEISQTVGGQGLPFSIYGITGILIAHVFFNASFAARILLHRFEAISPNKHKLGAALGLGFWTRVKTIELPAIAPSLPGLAVTIFLLCFTSFAIVLTLGGSPTYNTLEVAIYEAVKFDFDLPKAFQLAVVQIVICIALVMMANTKTNLKTNASNSARQNVFPLIDSTKLTLAHRLIIVIFSLFFIVPLIAVISDGVGENLLLIFADPVFQRTAITSLIIASLSTVIAVVLSYLISSAIVSLTLQHRAAKNRFAKPLEILLSVSTMLYLVLPALVMGLGFFILFQKIGGNSVLWSGTVVILANALIAIPFAVATLRPALFSIAKKHDRLATSLGLAKRLRWRLVDWPVLRPDITYVSVLAFCFSLGDMGVIALFGSDDFKTLPWLLYQKFGSYRTHDAAAIALVLLIIVLSVFWFAQRNINEREIR